MAAAGMAVGDIGIGAFHSPGKIGAHEQVEDAVDAVGRHPLAAQARDRLAASKKARVIARFALNKFWRPVGSGISSDAEVAHVMGVLFAGTEGRKLVRDMDSHISKLPGMEGLTIVENALDGFGIPAEGPGTEELRREVVAA